MINIIINKNNDNIVEVSIKGHAETSNNEVNNLVCSAITGIVSGACNAFDQIYPNQFEILCKEGYAKIKLLNKHYKNIENYNSCFKFLYFQLMTIYQQYNNYVSLKEQEE